MVKRPQAVRGFVIEFEVKAPVPPDHEAFIRRKLGEPESAEEHVDTYYQHPARDVVASDEAIRLGVRGDHVEWTYKGPRLDERTKSRREITLRLEDEGAARSMLKALGFTPAAEVRKHREHFHAEGFMVALDTVPGLGVFVELEKQMGEDEDRAEAERKADGLLRSWGLDARERRSYLELVRASGAAAP